MAITLLMAHYSTIHKYCQPGPTSLSFLFFVFFKHSLLLFFSLLFNSAFLYLPMRVKLCFRFKRGPSAFNMTVFQYPHTPFGFETAPAENQVTQATQSGREGMWSHLIVESLYSEWWQSALWLCSVRWALRLKPYTGKAPLVTLACQMFSFSPGRSQCSVATQSWWAAFRETGAESFWRWPMLPYIQCWKDYWGKASVRERLRLWRIYNH